MKENILANYNVGDEIKLWGKKYHVALGYCLDNEIDMLFNDVKNKSIEICSRCAFRGQTLTCQRLGCDPDSRADRTQVYLIKI